jgi:hypothetical protein
MANLAPNSNYINIVKGLYAIVAQGYQLPEKYQFFCEGPSASSIPAIRGICRQGYYELIIHYLPRISSATL